MNYSFIIAKNGQNRYVRGRILKIKKSTLLKASFGLASILFIFSSIFFIFFSRYQDFWFYCFLLEAGFCVFLRGLFLKIDSSYFLGLLMFFVGAMYFYTFFVNISHVFPSFLPLSFALASLLTYACFQNKLHAKSFVFFVFLSLSIFFFQISIIPFEFFLAISCFGVLIFILSSLC